MKKVAIIGSNIFAFGGTTRSNLNLFREFSTSGFDITYYNYSDYTQRELKQFRKKNSNDNDVKVRKVYELFSSQVELDFDYVFITRESFLAVAELIRLKNPQAVIIGEIHTPLSQLPDKLEGLGYLSCVRVATRSIKESFRKKYGFDRIYVQTVSLNHLSWSSPSPSVTHNLLIHSRFDDQQKDISYAIDLMEYLVKKLGEEEIRLYLNGSGPDQKKYVNLVKKKHLENHVLINKVQPKKYIYLSTAKVETLGYSIVEAIAQGHLIAAYPGDDGVIYENFQKIPVIAWIDKELEHDAQVLKELTSTVPAPVSFKFSEDVLSNFANNYVDKMVLRTAFFKNAGKNIANSTLDVTEIKRKLEKSNGPIKAPWYLKCYRFVLTFPALKKLLNMYRS